jgi:hypothetical protein
MCKEKRFNEIMDAVIYETSVAKEEIMSCHRQAEVVEARCLAVKCLIVEGWCAAEIARRLHIKRQSVARMSEIFDNKRQFGGKYFLVMCHDIGKKVALNLLK